MASSYSAYAIDCKNIRDLPYVEDYNIGGENEWKNITLVKEFCRTMGWYLENQDWVWEVELGEYCTWIEKNYANR